MPYLVLGKNWISYDDSDSLALKSKYVKDLGLAGAMVWSIETDDFLGICGKGKFPLLNVISSIIRNEDPEEILTTNSPATTAATESPISQFVCPSDGVFRDPKNCSKFYVCSGTSAFDFTCPNGLMFDLKTNTCNWPSQVDC